MSNKPDAPPCPLKPVGDKIVVRRADPVKKIGSIIIPETAQKKMVRGFVLAVGPGTLNEAGDLVPPLGVRATGQTTEPGVKVGDEVLFASPWGADDVEVDGQHYLVLVPGDVLAVIAPRG